MKKVFKLFAGVASVSMLSACSLGTVGQSQRTHEGMNSDAARYMYQSQQPYKTENTDNIQVHNDVWTGSSVRLSSRGEALPQRWEQADGFVSRKAVPMTLEQIGTEVTHITGISVQFAPDVFASQKSGNSNNDVNKMLSSMGVGEDITPLADNTQVMRVVYQGSLSDFITQVTSHFGVSWTYQGGIIHVLRKMTRTYTLNALPSSLHMKSSISADASSQQASSGGGQSSRAASGSSSSSVNNEVNVGIWEDINKAVLGIVGDSGTVTEAGSLGTLTVNAPPEVISRVDEYVANQNERLSKQLTVGITVLNVSSTATDNMDFNLQSLAERAGKAFVQYGSLGTGTAATGAATLASGASGLSFGVADANSPFNGLTGALSLLSTQGHVTSHTHVDVNTPNGIPAQVQVSKVRGYLAQVQVSNYSTQGTGSATSQSTLMPGSVTTGISFGILPRINMDGTGVLLQMAANISDLVGPSNGFRLISTAGSQSSIEVPDINESNFVQQAYIPNGGVLVMTGFDEVNDTDTRSGSGNPGFFGLGGAQSGNNQRNTIVILLTPQVSDISSPIEVN